LGCDVVAVHDRATVGRTEQRGEDPDRRRLAGAVRAEETEELAVADAERDAIHRSDGLPIAATAVDLDEVGDLDGAVGATCRPRQGGGPRRRVGGEGQVAGGPAGGWPTEACSPRSRRARPSHNAQMGKPT